MVISFFKSIASKLPYSWQQSIKRAHYHRQIKQETFITHEPEFKMVPSWVSAGDWVIDIGANIGHYTKKFSDVVGPQGRVISFEPVPETFSFLAGNVKVFNHTNVSLLNLAISDQMQIVGMDIPDFKTGLKNFYEAKLTQGEGGVQTLTIPLDSLNIPHRIKLIKMDVEGHEYPALEGMVNLLKRDHPTLIIETNSAEVKSFLGLLGYSSEKLTDSPNLVFHYTKKN